MTRPFNLGQAPKDGILVFPDTPPVPTAGYYLGVTSIDAQNRIILGWVNIGTQFLPIAGGTLSGPLILARDPTATMEAVTKRYADSTFIARAGGTMLGPLTLAQDPTQPLHAASKQYSDLNLARAGGTMTGNLFLNTNPTAPTQAATKAYVDSQISTGTGAYLPLAGGTITGPLTTYGGATITQLDSRIPSTALAWQDANGNIAVTIDTLGAVHAPAVYVAADPTQALQLTTKAYVDAAFNAASAGAFLPLAGGTLTGPLTVAGGSVIAQLDPRYPDIAFAWQDAAGNIGASISPAGVLFWPSIQTNNLAVPTLATTTLTLGADKFGAADPRVPDFVYVWQDSAGNIVAGINQQGTFAANISAAGMLQLSGGTMTGPLILAADPTLPLGAATKSYIDTHALLLTGGTMTGPIALAADPTSAPQAATKGYVDQAVLNAGGSGPGLDPTFNSVNVVDQYFIGGLPSFRIYTPSPGALGVPGIANTHIGQGIKSIGIGNTLIGTQTGGGQLPGATQMQSGENTYVGMQVGANHSGLGQQNTALGCGTLRVDPNPGGVISIGSDASRNSTNNLRSTYVGTHAGRNGNNLVDLVYIGYWVGYGTDGVMPSVTGTVAIGAFALSDPNMGSGSNSVFVGYNVARKGQSVPGNLLLGPNVGSSTLINGTGLIYLGASGAIDAATATENHTFRLGNHATNLMRAVNINTAAPKFFFDWLPASTSYSDDTTAKAGGVQYGQIYRNGSAMQICCLA